MVRIVYIAALMKIIIIGIQSKYNNDTTRCIYYIYKRTNERKNMLEEDNCVYQ